MEQSLSRRKFHDPEATHEARASGALRRLATLWINTGTLCNITCRNCYIESNPRNDRLAYVTAAEAAAYFEEIARLHLGTREVGFTGGEPFMNPLTRGPHQRHAADAAREGQSLVTLLKQRFGQRLQIRVSLDHYTQALHEVERGPHSWVKTIAGLDWLDANGFRLALAGRTCWQESESAARAGYARLIAERGWRIDASSPAELVLLPKMQPHRDVPEITNRCMMCVSSRMVVKRKGAAQTTVVPCTLIAYDPAFEMGSTLADVARADGGMFAAGAVELCQLLRPVLRAGWR